MRQSGLWAAVACAAAATPLAGQRIWKDQLYPYVYASSVDGFWGAAHFSEYSPIGFAEQPEPNRAALDVDAGASTQGSYFAIVDAQAPAYWEGWRFALTLTASRDNRLGYYGVGNGTVYATDSITATAPYFYRVSRSHQSVRATVQRRIIGPLRLLAGASLDHTSFRALPGGSAFARDLAANTIDSTRVPFTDRTARVGIVVDARDNEIDPHSGALVEGLVAAGRGYTRTTASAKLYLHPFERLVLAGRLAGETMTGRPPLAAELVMETSEQPFVAVGGYRSLRGYYDARFVGPGKLLGGLEARYGLLWAPTLFELNLVGFYDAGRVFAPGERVTVGTAGLHASGGVEIVARILRNGILALGYGRGSEGGQVFFGTTWSY